MQRSKSKDQSRQDAAITSQSMEKVQKYTLGGFVHTTELFMAEEDFNIDRIQNMNHKESSQQVEETTRQCEQRAKDQGILMPNDSSSFNPFLGVFPNLQRIISIYALRGMTLDEKNIQCLNVWMPHLTCLVIPRHDITHDTLQGLLQDMPQLDELAIKTHIKEADAVKENRSNITRSIKALAEKVWLQGKL